MIKKFKFLAMVLVVFQMVFGSLTLAFADDDYNANDYGTPNVMVTNGPIFNVDAGKTNEVTITVKNISSAGAKSVLVMPKVNEIENNPLTITFDSSSSLINSIGANVTRSLDFKIDVDKAAVAGTYSVNLDFTYFNQNGDNFSSTSTVYFKVKNITGENNLDIKSIELVPSALEVGGSGTANIEIKNASNLNLKNISLSVTDADSSSLSISGESIKKIATLQGGLSQVLSFNLLANSSMAEGNYPLTFTLTGTDENGTEHTDTQVYYIPVGVSGVGGEADLEVINLVEPSGEYDVNENFNISFDVFNSGDDVAENVTVSMSEIGGGTNVVPKSKSVVAIEEITSNSSAPISFTFAPTSASVSKNYTLEITLSYTKNGKETEVKQYAGVNVSNSDADEEESSSTSKPRIIISDFESDPRIVEAGKEFDLTMRFLNTHTEKTVKNIKMYLTLSEETSTDSASTGNIFTPVDSSNTFFFDEIPSKGTVEKKMTLYVVPDAQPKNYTLTVNFEYEDVNGNEYTATELLGINVKQSTKVETSEIFIPEFSELYMPVNMYFDIYNTGKVDISNLKILLDGDIESSSKSTYIGNLTKGESGYYEGSFSVINTGTNTVTMTIMYDDPSGEVVEEVTEYTIEGMEPMPMDPMMEGMGEDMYMEDMGYEEPMDTTEKLAIGGTIAAVLIIGGVILKKRKAKKAAAFIEADDDDDEEGIVM